MSSTRPNGSSLAELLDRILDKGIIIDLRDRVSLLGLEIITVEARLVIGSIETFLSYARTISMMAATTEPRR